MVLKLNLEGPKALRNNSSPSQNPSKAMVFTVAYRKLPVRGEVEENEFFEKEIA